MKLLIGYTGIGMLGIASIVGGCKENAPTAPADTSPPTISDFTVTGQNVLDGDSLQLTFAAADYRGLDKAILTYEPGSVDTILMSGTIFSATRSHIYSSTGQKYPSLSVSNKTGQSAQKSIQVTIGQNRLQAFITNGKDSSFVATYDVTTSGQSDQTFDAGVNTNTGITFADGSNWPLVFFKKLLYVYNFKTFWSPEDEGKLKGINLKVGNTYTYHIISDNTASPNYLGMPSTAQDSVEQEIKKYTDLLPPAWRPQIYRAKSGEAYPARGLPGDAILRPKDNLLVVARLNPDNPVADGINSAYAIGPTVIAGVIGFKIPFTNVGAQTRELAAPLFCIADYVPNYAPNKSDYSSEFDNISEFSTHSRAPLVTNSGIKAIYLNGLFDQGTYLEKFWKMPF